MCGRFTLRTPLSVLIRDFEVEMSASDQREFDFAPRYNIAPTQEVVVLCSPRRLTKMRWGLIPSWAHDPSIANRLLNARAETAATKPAFRDAYRRRRCIVPADGYYEWQKQGKAKQPYLFEFADQRPFALAGLWESWRPQADAAPVETCTLLTTSANDLAQTIHDRMPVILAPVDYSVWLNPASDRSRLDSLLRPWDAEPMRAVKVATVVNNPRNESAQCAEPWE